MNTKSCLRLLLALLWLHGYALPLHAQDMVETLYLAGQKTGSGTYSIPYGSENLIQKKTSDIKVFLIYQSGMELDLDQSIGTATVSALNANSCEVKVKLNADIPDAYSESLLFEFPAIHQAAYTSILYLVAGNGAVMSNEDGTPFTSIVDAHLYSESNESVILEEMRAHIASVASMMRGSMDDMDISGGLFDGQKLFDAMEATSIKNVHQFLTYVYVRPQKYRGSSWMLAEVYATWLISETPMPEVSESYFKGNLGINLSDANTMGYPHIEAWLKRIYESGQGIDIGSILLSIDGQSMYGKKASVAQALLEGEEGTTCTIRVLAPDSRLYELAIPRMHIRGAVDPTWNQQKGEVKEISLWSVTRGSLWGVIDANGYEIIPLKYDKVEGFSNGLALFEKGDKAGYLNYEGKEVIPAQWPKAYGFQEGLAAVFPNGNKLTFGGKPAFIDRTGKTVIPAKYETDLMTYGFTEGRYQVTIDEKTGYIDTSGQLVIPAKYKRTSPFNEGLAWVSLEKESLYGAIDLNGNWVIQPSYTSVMAFHEGTAVVTQDNASAIIDKKGNLVKKYDFSVLVSSISFGANPFQEGVARVKKGDLIGFASAKGEILAPFQFKHTNWQFAEGLIGVSEDNAHWSFVNSKGKKPFEGLYDGVSYFSDGLCWVKIGKLWGLIDKTGKMLIEPTVSSLPDFFQHGVCLVNAGNFMEPKHLLIDKEGSVLWK